MAQQASFTPDPSLKTTYQDIQLKFGQERAIEHNFALRDRNWSCLKNSTIDTYRNSQAD